MGPRPLADQIATFDFANPTRKMDQNSRFLPFLTIAAAASVVAFSSIGIAAITGHLPIAKSGLNPFSAFGGAPAVSKSSSNRAPAGSSNGGLTRKPGEAPPQGYPINFRPGARVSAGKPSCTNCGVVDSIEMQQASGDGDKFATALGATARAYKINRQELGSSSFTVVVRMENGTLRTVHESHRPPFSIGERVKLVNGTVIPLG